MVLGSVIEDMKVLADFTNSVGIDEAIVIEKFYERVEGILGSITGYNAYQNTVQYLLGEKEFVILLQTYIPKKKKNVLIYNMLCRKNWVTLYVYLFCKRLARKIVR